jgi:hypothetical protein
MGRDGGKAMLGWAALTALVVALHRVTRRMP